MSTPGGLVDKQELIDAQLDTAHLGRVVNSKDASGAPISTSTNRTGGVNKTLDALEGEYETSIANKEAEANDAIDAYRLLSKGPYASGILLDDKFQYITYNGESYFATNPPYTTTSTTPDNDTANLEVKPYLTESSGDSRYELTFKPDVSGSAVENMLLGKLSSGDIIQHMVGNLYSTGATKWEVIAVTSPMVLTNFKHKSSIQLDDACLGSSDVDASLSEIIGYCKSKEVYEVNVSGDYSFSDSAVTNKGSINFIGSGSISGLYRKKVTHDNAPSTIAFNDTIPTSHLKRFTTKENPVVVVVGDSISTEIADSVGYQSCLYGVLKNALTKANPDKNITFYNRGIGGETYFTAVGLPSSFPSWYTDTGKAWPLYVGELEPDLVIFNFGMNDSDAFQSSTIKSYQGLFDNSGIFTAGRPDVIYCTNLVPALDAKIGDFGTEAGQKGRDFVAGYTRTYAPTVDAGVLDMHRLQVAIRDGYDAANTYLELVGDITPVSGAVAASESCSDFQWEIDVSLVDASNPLSVKLGPTEVTDPSGRGSFVVITEASGLFNITLYDTASTIYADISPDSVAVPSGAFTCEIQKKGSGITILIDGVKITEYNGVITHGGDFISKAGDATYTSGNITAAKFYKGVPLEIKPSIVNDLMWGVSTSLVSIKSPYGGNGVNHPSSIGVASVFERVCDMNLLGGKRGDVFQVIDIDLFQNGFAQLSGFGDCKVTRHGDLVTLELQMTTPSEGATGVAFNLPGTYRPTSLSGNFVPLSDAAGSVAIGHLKPTGDFEITKGGNSWLFGSFTYSV